jgi:hypothetical protein
MTRTDWLAVVLGLIQAMATVGALYFAWRAVHEAQVAQRDFRKERAEMRRERLSRRLNEVVEAVNELDRATRGANGSLAQQRQLELQILLVGLDVPLPQTQAISDTPNIDTLDVMAGFQAPVRAAIDELRNASRSVLESGGESGEAA